MSFQKLIFLVLFFFLILTSMSTVSLAVEFKEVQASEILKQIENGEDIYFENCRVIGELNLNEIELKTVPNPKYPELLESGFREEALVFYGVNEDLKVIESNITIYNSIFENDVDFSNSLFKKSPSLVKVNFYSSVNFVSTTFGDDASFERTSFSDGADFGMTHFGDYADFEMTHFGDGVSFLEASFGHYAHFRGTSFGDSASLWGASFGDGADFGELVLAIMPTL